MAEPVHAHLPDFLPSLEPGDPRYATEAVSGILAAARRVGASDIHLQPAEEGLNLCWRLDGVLQPIVVLPKKVAPNIVARLKVLADLLTYQTDVPQEGRIREPSGDIEMRVSTFPTLYGEKAVVRLFAGSGRFRRLDDLGLPEDISAALRRLLGETGGVILLTGPAGSGKTTTAYACLRELAEGGASRRSIVTIEDPVESVVPGASQSQIRPKAGFGYVNGLRSLLRQDPDVILVGEIRDRDTAETVFQASLTGHLVLTTFHAGSAAEAIGRLSDMGIEPYLLRSGVLGIICQRLLRRLCRCARENSEPEARLGLEVAKACEPVGCEECRGTGYLGRLALAELLQPNLKDLGRAILSRSDAEEIEELAVRAGMISCRERAARAVDAALTSPAEVRRVFGFR